MSAPDTAKKLQSWFLLEILDILHTLNDFFPVSNNINEEDNEEYSFPNSQKIY